jgi:hypothetical protein
LSRDGTAWKSVVAFYLGIEFTTFEDMVKPIIGSGDRRFRRRRFRYPTEGRNTAFAVRHAPEMRSENAGMVFHKKGV